MLINPQQPTLNSLEFALGQQAKVEWKQDLRTKRRCLSWECQADGR